MKKQLYTSALILASAFFSVADAQQHPDQNPSFQASREKYMAIADSLNLLHSTTVQQTYKAYDWYEAKIERRAARQEFRRALRMERARGHYPRHRYNNHYRSGRYYGQNYYQPPYYWNFCW